MLTVSPRLEHRQMALAAINGTPLAPLQPFGLSPDPHFIYRSDPYLWAFEQVTTGVRQREGLILVTGEPGTGKTLLCRTLLSRLSERHIISVVLHPCATFEELLLHVLHDFGVLSNSKAADGLRRHDLIAMLHHFLASLIPLNRTAVLVIDEAQHLPPAVLEELRLLSNCESDHAKLLQIVLVGTSALDETCRSEHLRHLDQRIARRCRLRPLERTEVADYIENRLRTAGWPSGAFSAPALQMIALLSGGVPRTINLLCERSMDIARRRGVSPIDRTVVRGAATQLDLSMPRTWLTGKRTAVVASVLLVALPPATWLCASQGLRITHAATARASAPVEHRVQSTALASVAPSGIGAVSKTQDPVVGTLTLADGLTIQVGSFQQADRAAAIVQQLRTAGLPAFRRLDGGTARSLVLVGPYTTDGEAEAVQEQLAVQGYAQTKVKRENAGVLLP